MLRVVLAGEPVASLSESLSTIAFMCGYVGHPAAVAYRILRNDSDRLSINEGQGRAQTRHRRAQVTLFGAPGYHLVQPSNGHRRPERWPRTGSDQPRALADVFTAGRLTVWRRGTYSSAVQDPGCMLAACAQYTMSSVLSTFN